MATHTCIDTPCPLCYPKYREQPNAFHDPQPAETLKCGHHRANWIIEDEESGHGFCGRCHPERLKQPAAESEVDHDWRRQMEAYGFDSVAKVLDRIAAERADAVKGLHVLGCVCCRGERCDWCADYGVCTGSDSDCIAARQQAAGGEK
jgi:hypothetical protein